MLFADATDGLWQARGLEPNEPQSFSDCRTSLGVEIGRVDKLAFVELLASRLSIMLMS